MLLSADPQPDPATALGKKPKYMHAMMVQQSWEQASALGEGDGTGDAGVIGKPSMAQRKGLQRVKTDLSVWWDLAHELVAGRNAVVCK